MRWNQRFTVICLALSACTDPHAIDVLHSHSQASPDVALYEEPPSSCSFSQQVPDPVVVMATPASNATQVLRVYTPLFERLHRTTGIHFELRVPSTYAELKQALLSGKAHLGIASPLTYVQARLEDPCVQLLLTSVSAGFSHYSAYFLVRADSPYSSLEDLKGARLALLGTDSASGSLYPEHFFKRNGIVPDEWFHSVTRYDNHLAALHALQDKHVDIVPTYSGVFAPARRDGIQMSLFRVFTVMERIPNDALVASRYLPKDMARQIADAIFALNQEFLTTSRGVGNDVDLNGWIYTRDSLYDPLRLLLGSEEAP